ASRPALSHAPARSHLFQTRPDQESPAAVRASLGQRPRGDRLEISSGALSFRQQKLPGGGRPARASPRQISQLRLRHGLPPACSIAAVPRQSIPRQGKLSNPPPLLSRPSRK